MSPPSTADKIKAGAADAYAQAKVLSLKSELKHKLNTWLELVIGTPDLSMLCRTKPLMHMTLPAMLRMKPPGTPPPLRRPRAT